MEFIGTSDPYLWSAVSVEAAMEEGPPPVKKICFSPAQLAQPDSTTTEHEDIQNIFALAEGQIVIIRNELQSSSNNDNSTEESESYSDDSADSKTKSSVISSRPILPNIRGRLLDHPKMIKIGKQI